MCGAGSTTRVADEDFAAVSLVRLQWTMVDGRWQWLLTVTVKSFIVFIVFTVFMVLIARFAWSPYVSM